MDFSLPHVAGGNSSSYTVNNDASAAHLDWTLERRFVQKLGVTNALGKYVLKTYYVYARHYATGWQQNLVNSIPAPWSTPSKARQTETPNYIRNYLIRIEITDGEKHKSPVRGRLAGASQLRDVTEVFRVVLKDREANVILGRGKGRRVRQREPHRKKSEAEWSSAQELKSLCGSPSNATQWPHS